MDDGALQRGTSGNAVAQKGLVVCPMIGKKTLQWMIMGALLTGGLSVFLWLRAPEEQKLLQAVMEPQQALKPSHHAEEETTDMRQPLYKLQLQFDPNKQLLSGTSHIEVWNRSKLSTREAYIQLFLNGFTVETGQQPVLPEFYQKAYPYGVDRGSIQIQSIAAQGRSVPYKVAGTEVRIELAEPWQTASKLVLELQWEADIPTIHHRVGIERDAYWFGNVLPLLAVYDGAWHSYPYYQIGDPFYSEAADFEVELSSPEGYTVFSTGTQEPIHQEAVNGFHQWTMKASQVRDFAFALSSNHAVVIGETESGINVSVAYRKGTSAKAGEVLRQVIDMLEFMERELCPYPYSSLHVFENEMFITGMEYPGLVFIDADRFSHTRGVETIVHEVAHQWFYNMIGSDQVNEPWLDEGFATYYTNAFLLGDQLNRYYEQQKRELAKQYPDTSIRPVVDYGKWSDYWRANYVKSSLMIHQLRQELGDEAFTEMMKQYAKEFTFGIVTKSSFIQFVEQFQGRSYDEFFREWLK